MLAELPFFREFTLETLRLISAYANHVRLEGDVEIFRAGDPADRFYVLRSGQISVETAGPGGRALVLQVLGAGELLGWSWLFPPHFWQFSARTLEPVDAVCFAGSKLRLACESEPALGFQLVRGMAAALVERLAAARSKLAELAAAAPPKPV